MYKFIIPLFALAFLLASCAKQTPPADNFSVEPPATFNNLPTEGDGSVPTEVMTSSLEKARQSYKGELLKGKYTVIIHSSKGDITVELDADVAPKTVTNFILLARAGYYDGTTVHRVIPGFMIQMGDPNGNGTGGESVYGASFEDEINANSYGLDKKKVTDIAEGQDIPAEVAKLTVKALFEQQGYKYNDKLQSLPMVRGVLAMANRGPATNGSQFFIIQGASTPWLEGKHTVFGKVTVGMDIVDTIAKLERDGNDLPNELVKVKVEVKN